MDELDWLQGRGMSKCTITVDHLKLACRHFEEMMDANVGEKAAIRTLELFADVYAKGSVMGNASLDRLKRVESWSIKAKQLQDAISVAKPEDHFQIHHGTPRRGFVREILNSIGGMN
jgi:hypothetical protein